MIDCKAEIENQINLLKAEQSKYKKDIVIVINIAKEITNLCRNLDEISK